MFLECLFDNTNFLGGGLSAEDGGQGIETKGYQACSLECQKRLTCNYWTFVEKWKVNCYLKSSLGEKADFDGAVSGTYDHFCGKAIVNISSNLSTYGMYYNPKILAVPLQPKENRPSPPTTVLSSALVAVNKNEGMFEDRS